MIIAVDESGSMLPSIIHSAVMAGIFARLPMLTTHLVIFDTAVVDLTGRMDDPVETLMSVHLGGGTDIAKAVGYCKELITAPRRTIVVLVSDLCEGGSRQSLYRTCHDIVESGARLIALTALNEHSVPDYDRATAQTLADLGAHVGAMTPERLADFMAGIMRE